MRNPFAMSILLVCCGPGWAGPNLDAAATDVCECLEAPYEQVEQALQLVRAAQASGDMSGIMAAQGEMMQVLSASGECFDALVEKYPEIDKSDTLKAQVMEIADEKCPNPAAGMAPPQ